MSGADGLASLRHEPAGPGINRLVLQARRGDLESLPLVLDPAALPQEALVLDLSQGGWFEGLVLDRAGQPVASARVGARPEQGDGPEQRLASGHSDEQGRFRLGPLLPDVEHRVEAHADGFLDQELRHLLPGPPPLELVLAPVVSWRGRTLDAAAGTPLPEFWGQLALEYEEQGKLKERNTGERLHLASGGTGEFWFELPGPGRYRIRLWARDHVAVASDPWDFDGVNAPPFATLALAPAAMLELTVLDGRGRPVPGYSVAVAPWSVAEKAKAPAGHVRKQAVGSRTDDLGVARLNLGEGGTYRVAGGPGLWLDDAPLTVTPGPPVARLYRLPPTTDLEVHVTDEAGQPVLGAMIEVRTARDEKVHAVSRRVRTGTDPPGLALVEALPPASYDVIVRRRGFENAQQTTVISGVALERLDVRLATQPADAAPAQGGVLQPGGKAR
ncbi:MAG: carboxypeptidase regulatory-like domain-containing protein [Planctomycetes bacterium]|nr:carboxypeptidase regulatory-like domain-containing protein [Planctomycetota bacterium]